jgi:hypothetical protein
MRPTPTVPPVIIMGQVLHAAYPSPLRKHCRLCGCISCVLGLKHDASGDIVGLASSEHFPFSAVLPRDHGSLDTVPYSSPGCVCRPVLTPSGHSVVISVKTLSGMPVTGASATRMLTLTCCASADADPRSKAMAHTVAKHRITASRSLLGRGNLRLSIGRPDYAHQSYTHLTRHRAARRSLRHFLPRKSLSVSGPRDSGFIF